MAKAGSAVIGALRVVLGADTAAFETGLKSAQKTLSTFGKSVAKPIAAISAAIAGAAGIMATGIKLALNRANEMNQVAQKIGVPVEQLSALAHAADLTDVSFDALTTGLKKFSSAISSNAPEFKALGIDLKDGLEGTDTRLLQVADAFASMEDGANKTALAVKLFGKAGIDLIPLLNQGSAGIKKMTDEARELGLVITKDTAEAADQFNTNLTRLGAVFSGVFLKLAAQVAGPLAKFTDWLVSVAKNADLAGGAVEIFKEIMRVLAGVVLRVTDGLREFAIWVAAIRKIWNMPSSGGDFLNDISRIGAIFSDATAQVQALTKQTERAIKDLNTALNKPITGGGADISLQSRRETKDTGPSEEEIAAEQKAAQAAEQRAKSIAELVAGLKAEAAAIGETALQQAILNNLNQAGADATEAEKQAVIEATTALVKKQEAQEQLARTNDAEQKLLTDLQAVYQSTLDPAERFAFALAELNRLFETGRLPVETYNEAMQNLKRDLEPSTVEIGKILDDIAQALETTLADVFDDLINKTFEWKDALASALRLAAQIIGGIGQRSITNAGGWGAILGSFATGGEFTVAGSGGTDSQVVSFRATPGETVTIMTPAQQRQAVEDEDSRRPTGPLMRFATGGSFTVGGSGGIDSQLVQFMATPGERVLVSQDDITGGGFAFAPQTVIDARGSDITPAKLKAILDQRDEQWRNALPGAFRQARVQGKV